MLKKTIKFTDYNGVEREEDFYFHLNKAEIVSMQLKTAGGLDGTLKRITQRQSGKDIMDFFENLISKSYGVKSPDGRKFIKNQDVLNDFIQTEAYNELFIELVTDANKAAAFFNELIPDISDVAAKIAENAEKLQKDSLKAASNIITVN